METSQPRSEGLKFELKNQKEANSKKNQNFGFIIKVIQKMKRKKIT